MRLSFILCCFLLWHSLAAQEIKPPFPTVTVAQQSTGACATDVLLQAHRQSNFYKAAEYRMNEAIRTFRQTDDTTLLTLPVVFHIVDDNPFVFSDAQVAAVIQDLNDAFSKSGAYAASTGDDTRIRFCLAQKDPDGGISNGITRTVSFFTNDLNPLIEDGKLKNLVRWNPAQYINIWYIKSMHLEIMARFQCGAWQRMFAGGYATMPPGGGPTDGIVVTAFGTMLAHEMGHYLGLYHTFEGLDCANFDCTLNGDRVCDTPPDASVASTPCGSPPNSCNTDTVSGLASNLPDMISNFMDYSNPACQNAFTQGQKDRMRAAINTQRPGLLVDKCAPPCTDAIAASFTRDNPYPLEGAAINFINTSTGATDYEWTVDGTTAATTASFSTSFATKGKYKVTLKASTGGSCYSTFTHEVIVTCGVTARFYTNKREIAARAPRYLDSIQFTNKSEGSAGYRWLMANDKGMTEQVVSTAVNFKYVFTTPANYTVRLIATNGACSDTTLAFTIPVTDPTPDGVLYFGGAECYQQTKVRLRYYVCNLGYDGIRPNLPISFYSSDPRLPGAQKIATINFPDSVRGQCCGVLRTVIIDVGYAKLNQLYGVFNDSGTAVPIALPNTNFEEKFYTNNIAFASGFAFGVTASPALSVAEWGDTLQLTAIARPGTASYAWSSAANLSCTACPAPKIIADTTTTKQVIATSPLGCVDTARVVVQVPPYNDFTVEITDAQCKGQDSLRVAFTIRNSFKRAVIPKGLAVAFFNGDPSTASAVNLPNLFAVPDTVKAGSASFITTIKGMGSGTVYAVVNDSGKTVPVVLPSTPFEEKAYGNNIASFNYTRFNVTPNPALVIAEWRDTLPLSAIAGPGTAAGFTWSNAYNLSCAACQSPDIVADTTQVKRVVAVNSFGCKDTTSVSIQVPPYNDFTVTVDEVQCARNDSLFVRFTINNSFKRPLLPGRLSVSFYNGNPAAAGAVRLNLVFSLPDTLYANSVTLSGFIKGMPAGTLYAVVNDSASPLPISFPATRFLEKDYSNNITPFAYAPEVLQVRPADTTVFRKETAQLQLLTPVYNPASTLWWGAGINPISCTACINPTVTVLDSTRFFVQTENRYGCMLKGSAGVKVFPPDFTITVDTVECYTNNTTRVTFTLCIHNGYDSLWKNLPLSFYDGDASSASLLLPTFSTPVAVADTCVTYTAIVASPTKHRLTAVVNDKGVTASSPTTAFSETDYGNNRDTISYTPFTVSIIPGDTAISQWGQVQLSTVAGGGTVTKWWWKPSGYLSCAGCAQPIATPPHTTQFEVLARNEWACTDTATVIVRTFSSEGLYLPSAFTPNGDGKNDVFYIVSGPEVSLVKSFAVYNRWGQQVFSRQGVEANSPMYGWNGKVNGADAPSSVFVYTATVVLKNGKEKLYKGTVTLIR